MRDGRFRSTIFPGIQETESSSFSFQIFHSIIRIVNKIFTSKRKRACKIGSFFWHKHCYIFCPKKFISNEALCVITLYPGWYSTRYRAWVPLLIALSSSTLKRQKIFFRNHRKCCAMCRALAPALRDLSLPIGTGHGRGIKLHTRKTSTSRSAHSPIPSIPKFCLKSTPHHLCSLQKAI